MNVIEPAQTEWAAPIVFDLKRDGVLRLCVDYRKLSAGTAKDSYTLSRMDECKDSFGVAQVFLTLNANSGYWKVQLREENRDRTALSLHHGLFRFIHIPFSLEMPLKRSNALLMS